MAGDDDVARGRERRWLLWTALAVGVATLVAVVVGVTVGRAQDPDPEPLGAGAWALLIGVPFGVALVAAGIGAGVAFWRRRRGSALFARSPLWELPTQNQRRHLIRALRRGQPVDPEQHDLALRTARDIGRRRGLVWLYLGLVVLQAGNVVLQEGTARWFYVVSLVLFLGVAGYWAWLVHRMNLAARRLDPAA